MMMHNPPHPGETLREDVLPALDVGVTEAAGRLGVSRQTLSAVLNGRQAITPEMAARLEAWIGAENGGRAEVWLAQQAAFDLWRIRLEKAADLGSIKNRTFTIALKRPPVTAVAAYAEPLEAEAEEAVAMPMLDIYRAAKPARRRSTMKKVVSFARSSAATAAVVPKRKTPAATSAKAPHTARKVARKS